MIVDLTHPVEDGMETYPGLPGPTVETWQSHEDTAPRYAPGTSFHFGRVTMIANTGTYLDAPAHRFDGGADVSAVPLDAVADVDGVVVDCAGAGRALAVPDAIDVRGRAVLLRTGMDRHWRTPAYAVDSPFLTRDGALDLVARGAVLVGIDAVNIDSTDDPARPAHTELLRAGVLVLEHLRNLESLPPTGFRLHAAPVPVRGMGTFPVRAYAVVP